MIYSKTRQPIIQPQSGLVRAGIRAQQIPVVGNLLTKQVTEYCKMFKHSKKSLERIQDFVKTYKISRDRIERCQGVHSDEECWNRFPTLNEFFIRRRINLPKVRQTQKEVVSPADAYTVFVTRPKFWIKGSKFNSSMLMTNQPNQLPSELALIIFRLAPQHYHRFHCPVYGRVTKISTFGTHYYSVDKTIVQSSTNVYTENVRVVLEIQTPHFGKIYLAIIGATCVGSIVLTHPQILKALKTDSGFSDNHLRQMGSTVEFSIRKAPLIKINEEMGFFQYGGSTIVLGLSITQRIHLLPVGDIIYNHTLKMAETEIEVGDSLLGIRK